MNKQAKACGCCHVGQPCACCLVHRGEAKPTRANKIKRFKKLANELGVFATSVVSRSPSRKHGPIQRIDL